MVAVKERRLEIKSHNDDVLSEVKAYFEKYPKLPYSPSLEEVSEAEKQLRNEIEYLKYSLNK